MLVSIIENKCCPMNSIRQILDREKIGYSNGLSFDSKLIFTNLDINNEDILSFIKNGGTCIADNQINLKEYGVLVEEKIQIQELYFPELGLEKFIYPNTAIAYKYNGEKFGYFKAHEKRIVKNNIDNGKKPIFIKINIGKGVLYASAINFDDFYNINGDVLRPIVNRGSSSEVSERISQIDKGSIAYVLKMLIKKIFKDNNIPYVNVSYLPKKAKKVFVFRMDLDGSEEENIIPTVVGLCKKYMIPGTFYANKNYMEASPEYLEQLKSINGICQLGNHGVVHNVFDSFEENYKNISECDKWLEENGLKSQGFVAPRGIWNPYLDKALEACGYDYSSDFGIDYNDLPFRPYIDGKPSNILQIPVNPYSVGRAEIYKKEIKENELSDQEILDYYEEYIKDETSSLGNGFVMIYGHPNGLGKRPEVIEKIFEKITNDKYTVLSVKDFKDWWIYREKIEFSIIDDKRGNYIIEIPEKYKELIDVENVNNVEIKFI